MQFSSFTTKKIEEVLKELNSSGKGLSEKEAKERLEKYGFNEVKAKETGPRDILFRQLKSPFIYLLFAASIVAFLIGEEIDSLIILLFVAINVSLGFFQEYKAERAVLLLRKYTPLKARVLREGKERIIEKRLLVPGDIVLLEAGSTVPADLRVLKTENFLIDESILSGESVSVAKISESLKTEAKEIFEAKNIVFAGTSVVSGEAEGLVIGTGREMVLGEITKLISKIKKESVYERDLIKFSRLILRIVLVTIVFVFVANLVVKKLGLVGGNFEEPNYFMDFLIFCIALIVSILPEALPVVVTFSLSQGALKLAKKHVVVKRLSASEDLGNIEILCTDKTGTITENKLTLEKISAPDEEKCLQYALFASPYVEEEIESTKNPFDFALFQKASQDIRRSLKTIQTISEISFDPFRLRNSVIVEDKSKRILIIRGAPEIILDICSEFGEKQNKNEIKKEIEKEGREGKRTLAVAFKEFTGERITESDEKDLTLLGFFTFKDPLKKTAKEAIDLAKRLGVKIKIITGDSPEVAGQIGKKVGLVHDPHQVVLGKVLETSSETELEKFCEEYSVFARVSPDVKYKIVMKLQEKYEVGFLGEGINDAPALKASHLAIAVDSAADVSRDVSDIILLKRDLNVIIDGIKEGRNIFSNINKYIKCTVASNFGNFYSIAAISLFIPFLPMLPVQILMVNLLSDFPLIAVASDKVDIEELRKPKAYRLNKFIFLIILLALVSTVFDFIFFGIFRKSDPSLLRSLWFIESILTEIALIFSIRSSHFFLKAKAPSMPLLLISALAIIVTVALPFIPKTQKLLHFTAPPFNAILILAFLIVSYLCLSEIVKLFFFRYRFKK